MRRRSFMAALFGAGLAPAFTPVRGFRGLLDPRLTARPHRPHIEPESGATVIGPHLERSGILYLPDSYSSDTPAPLVVALHGGGGRADGWSRLYEACEEHGIILVAPESRGRTWDRMRGDFGPDVGFIDSALRYVFDRCVVDPTRLALAGFSDGASYALSLGPSNGDLFTHLMAWSPGFSAPDDPIVGLPHVLVTHGTEDRVLPVGLSRGGIVPLFEMDGYSIEYVEFDGGHEMTPEVIAQSMEWFLA